MKRRSEARMKERRYTSSAEDGRAREEEEERGQRLNHRLDHCHRKEKGEGYRAHGGRTRRGRGHNAQEDGGRLGQGAGEVISLGKKALLLMFLQSVGQVVE
jgi:hypothetical protein